MLEVLEPRLLLDGGGELAFIEAIKNDPPDVTALLEAHSVVISPDDAYVYTAAFSGDALAVFSRNDSTGELTLIQQLFDGGMDNSQQVIDGLDAARFVTMDAIGDHVYVAGQFDDAIAVFDRNQATGELTFVEAQIDGVNGVDGLDSVQSVTVSPDGKSVYATGEFDNALAVFSRDMMTGKLTFVETQIDNVNGVDGLAAAQSVTVSSDARHVYATGLTDNAVAVFSRDTTTGELTFVEVLKDGQIQGSNTIEGLAKLTPSL